MEKETVKDNVQEVEKPIAKKEIVKELKPKIKKTETDNALDLIQGNSSSSKEVESIDLDRIVKIQVREDIQNFRYMYNGEQRLINVVIPSNIEKNKYPIIEIPYGEYLVLKSIAENYFKRAILVMLDKEVLEDDNELKQVMIAVATISDLNWMNGNNTEFKQNLNKIPLLLTQQFVWAIKRNKKAQEAIKYVDKMKMINERFKISAEEIQTVLEDTTDKINVAN